MKAVLAELMVVGEVSYSFSVISSSLSQGSLVAVAENAAVVLVRQAA